MDECCNNCYYCCAVRKYPTFQEVLTHICVLFVVEEQSDYIIETTGNDLCECWTERKDNERKAD